MNARQLMVSTFSERVALVQLSRTVIFAPLTTLDALNAPQAMYSVLWDNALFARRTTPIVIHVPLTMAVVLYAWRLMGSLLQDNAISVHPFTQSVFSAIHTTVVVPNAPVVLELILLLGALLARLCTTPIVFCVFHTMVAVLHARLALGMIH